MGHNTRKPRTVETVQGRDERLKQEADKAEHEAAKHEESLDAQVRRSIELHGA